MCVFMGFLCTYACIRVFHYECILYSCMYVFAGLNIEHEYKTKTFHLFPGCGKGKALSVNL